MASSTSGSCLCGASAFTYTNEPALKALCYCSACRKISGGTNTVNFAVPEQNFTLTKGQPKSFSMEHEWGMTLTVNFCPECGTTLWKDSTAEHLKGLRLVQGGTVADAKKLDGQINAELYAPERVAWLAPLGGAAQKETL
ncbi:hypothetical protein ACJ41O_001473 [Fusarium nematophilum]